MRRTIAPLSAALILACAASPLAAQGEGALHVEMLGPAPLSSVNYEHVVGSFSARVGLGWMPGFDNGDRLHTPLMLNVIAGRGVHRLEAGAGPVLVYALNVGPEEEEGASRGFRRTYTAGTLAYRLEPGEGSPLHGGIYRFGVTPTRVGGETHAIIAVSAGFYLSALRGSGRTAAALRR